MRSPLVASRRSLLLGRAAHQHPCGHSCLCYMPRRQDCLECSRAAVNKVLAKQLADDRMTTEQLLERRG
jgi:hypothetical protein